jgi:hypothetical protein
MAEAAGRAKTGNPTTDSVTITYSQANGYGFNPADSDVAYNGTVQFITSRACWVWTWVGTTPTNVFSGQTNYYVACAAGSNNFTANVPDIDITTEATNPNSAQPPPPDLAALAKGSIKVGSMIDGKPKPE